jgi:hypothetical protein
VLIERCLCGSVSWTQLQLTKRGQRSLTIANCLNCATKWRVTHKAAEEFESWYSSGGYHDDEKRHPDCRSYADRYAEDFLAATKRLDRYDKRIGSYGGHTQSALDVGAAAGAFVDAARERGFHAIGLEPDERFAREHVLRGTIQTTSVAGDLDLITYHDVLEHIADPLTEIRSAATLLSKFGYLVIEVPDVHVEAGEKHYKLEHLWYFTLRSLADLVHDAGLESRLFDYPIPGKMAVFACRPR